MIRTAIYMRVSTQAQAQEGDSLSAQRDALIAYINARDDHVLIGEYMDDGISGQKYEQRDELQRMLQDVKDGKIDLILCTKMDRLHRSLKNFLTMQELLDKYHVPWIAIWEPMYDTTTPAGQLIINQMMGIAQFEAQNTGARIRQVVQYKIQQGQVVSGSTPPGYHIVDKRLAPDGNAENVRTAFEQYARHGNIIKTMDHCRGLTGLPTYHASFRAMLSNPIYIGEHRGNPSFCPPLISRELFEDVQRKLRINVKKNQVYDYIFSGLLICDECGRKLGAGRKCDAKNTPIYRCLMHYAPPRKCSNAKIIRERILDEYLLANLKDMLSGYILECEVKAAPVIDNSKKLDALDRKIARLKDLYLEGIISIDEYKTDREKFLAEKAAISSESLPTPADTSHLKNLLASDIPSICRDMTNEEKRYFYRSFIREIRFSKSREITVVFI